VRVASSDILIKDPTQCLSPLVRLMDAFSAHLSRSNLSHSQ